MLEEGEAATLPLPAPVALAEEEAGVVGEARGLLEALGLARPVREPEMVGEARGERDCVEEVVGLGALVGLAGAEPEGESVSTLGEGVSVGGREALGLGEALAAPVRLAVPLGCREALLEGLGEALGEG